MILFGNTDTAMARIRIHALVVTPVLALVVSGALSYHAHAAVPTTQSTTAPKASWVLPLLNAPRATVEKTLGKPEFDEDGFVSYNRKGFSGVQVIYEDGKSVSLQIDFKTDPGTWSKAMGQLDLPVAGVKGEEEKGKNDDGTTSTYYILKNVKGIPKNWEVMFFPSSKGTDPDGVVVDEPAGLTFMAPM